MMRLAIRLFVRTTPTLPAALAGAILAGIITTSSAQAQVADLARATCAQLMDLPRNDRGQLMVWLHGYYAGAAQRPVLDRMALDEAVTAIQQACERHREMALIGSEARAIFLGNQRQTGSLSGPGQDTPERPSRLAPAPSR